MNAQKISIIIPVYNAAPYLKRCLESVVEQTYKNLEIILVDDGSTDDSANICDQYKVKDKRIIVVRQSNMGQGAARNKGLEIMTGDHCMFVDADDYVDKTIVERLCEACNKYGVDVVLCGLKTSTGYSDGWYMQDQRMDTENLMKEYIQGRIHTGPVCKLFPKNAFSEHRFPEMRKNEDAVIMHEVLGSCKSAYIIGQRMYFYMIRENSTERKIFSVNDMNLLVAATSLREYVLEKFPALYCYCAIAPAMACTTILDKMYLHKCSGQYPEIHKHILETVKAEISTVKVYAGKSVLYKKCILLIAHPKIFALLAKTRAALVRAKRKCEVVTGRSVGNKDVFASE